VILIQAHVRGWITRRAAERDKHNIVVIQVGYHITLFLKF